MNDIASPNTLKREVMLTEQTLKNRHNSFQIVFTLFYIEYVDILVP